MKRKLKKLGILILVVVLACQFWGCGKADNVGENKANSELNKITNNKTNNSLKGGNNLKDGDSSKNGDSSENENNNLRDLSLTEVSQDEKQDRCSNEKGFYYINKSDDTQLKNGEGAYHLMYMDYATKKEVYLCSNAGCKHNTEDCTSVISSAMQDTVLFWFKDYLYLLDKPMDQEGQYGTIEENTDYQPVLYRMNPDGSNREVVHKFKINTNLGAQIMTDGTDLYFIKKQLENEKVDKSMSYSVVSKKNLIKLDLNSGEEKEICDLNVGEKKSDSWKCIGCYDSKMVMSGLVYDHELTKSEVKKDIEDSNFGRELLDKSKTEIGVIDINSGKFEKVCSFSNKVESTYQQIGKYLYLSTDENNQIKKIDLDTKKESILAKTKENCIVEKYSDALFCMEWGDMGACFVNLKDGKVMPFKLRTETGDFDIEIMAETEDMYLVVYNIQGSHNDDDSWDVKGKNYALIKKKDFYENKNNWMPIKMITSGGIN
ncbi:MAG: hypothetical protein ACLVFL_10640 [Eubacterium sp.]